MGQPADLFSAFDDDQPTPVTAAATSPVAPPAAATTPATPVPPAPSPSPRPSTPPVPGSYSASDIEVLEGLEPVRRRPGMYIGGTDAKALHHLFAEVIDNSMDEAVAGHASLIEVHLGADGFLTVTDNGRGIPVENHPKFPGKSTLEIVHTVLHAGGKFDCKAYETSGGLHGVGVSVVNALSDDMAVEVARDQNLYRNVFSRGLTVGPMSNAVGRVQNRRGTLIRFHPDPQIFGAGAHFSAARLFRMARSKAYLFGGVELRWSCAPERLTKPRRAGQGGVPLPRRPARLPGRTDRGSGDASPPRDLRGQERTQARQPRRGGMGRAWSPLGPMASSTPTATPCRPPTAAPMRRASASPWCKGLKSYAELSKNKRAGLIYRRGRDRQRPGPCSRCSCVSPNSWARPRTSCRRRTPSESSNSCCATRWTTGWPTAPSRPMLLAGFVIERAEDRLRRRKDKEVQRAQATRKLRLPGKLADCSPSPPQRRRTLHRGRGLGRRLGQAGP